MQGCGGEAGGAQAGGEKVPRSYRTSPTVIGRVPPRETGNRSDLWDLFSMGGLRPVRNNKHRLSDICCSSATQPPVL